MSLYMLNLIFDPNNTNGLFADYSNTPPILLNRSKTWLTCPDPANFETFNPLTAPWTDLSGDGTVVISKQSTVSPICVRVAPASAITNPTLRLSVVFGRKQKSQAFASPFTLNNAATGTSCTVFDSNFDAPQLSDGSWFYPLRPVAIAPASTGRVYRFEFVAGITVVVNGRVMTFGHDPEMDVEM